MWITQFFSLISLVLVTTHALPTRILDDPITQNAIVSINANENVTDDRVLGTAEFRHPIVQSKPRILVSYGNMYKQAPVDPMQNLLMYFLMNVARDFAQDQDQFEKRRSPNFISDAKSTITDFAGKVINTSKKVGQKVGEKFKALATRDIPLQTQFEETHYYPHIDGTCMCFNRLIRHGSIEMKNDRLKENLVNEVAKQQTVELSTEKRTSDITDGQLKTEKTTELKTENHDLTISGKEKSTVAVAENEPITRQQDNSGVRVLKVMDLDSLDASKSVGELTTEQKTELEQKIDDDLVVELKAIQQDISKKSPPLETCKPPLTDTSQLTKKEPPNIKKGKPNEDDGYYFLSVSGGTDKRTTAATVKPREHISLQHYENLLPKYEDKLPRLKELKRKRRRFKRHHPHLSSLGSPVDAKSGLHLQMLEDKSHKRLRRHERHRDDFLLSDDKLIGRSPNIGAPDIPVLMLPNAFRSENEKQHFRSFEAEPPTQQTMLLTITLPTFLGGGVFLLGLCYFLRAKGWCCQLFMDKSNIVVVDNIEQRSTEETTE